MRPSDAYIVSDNGLSLGQHKAIIWTYADILLIGPFGTNFIKNLIKIQTFSVTKICLKMSSAKCCPFRLGLNVYGHHQTTWCTMMCDLDQYFKFSTANEEITAKEIMGDEV